VSWNRATYGWPIEGFGKKTGGIRIFQDKILVIARPYEAQKTGKTFLPADWVR
jgi:hypothetical protein